MASLSERYEQYRREKDYGSGFGERNRQRSYLNSGKSSNFTAANGLSSDEPFYHRSTLSSFSTKPTNDNDIKPIGTTKLSSGVGLLESRYKPDYTTLYRDRYGESPIKILKTTPLSDPQKLFKSNGSSYRPLQLSKIKKKPTKKSGYFSTLRQFLLGSGDNEKKSVTFNDSLKYSRLNQLTDTQLLQDDIVDQTIERNRSLLEELEQQKMLRNEEIISTLRKELEQERLEKQKLSNAYALELKELQDDHYRQVKNLNQTLEDLRNETHREQLRHQQQVEEVSSRKYREALAEKQALLREIESKETQLRAKRSHLENMERLIDIKQRELDNLFAELHEREARLDSKQAILTTRERQIELEFQTLHEQKEEVQQNENEFDLKYQIYKINKDYINKLCELRVQLTTIEIDIIKNRQEYTKHDGHLYELTILEVEKSVFQKLKAMLSTELRLLSSEGTSVAHLEKQLAFYKDLFQSMEEKKITKMKKLEEIDSALASSTNEDTSRQLCKRKHRHLNDLQQVHKIFTDFHRLLRLLVTKIIWNQSGRPTEGLTLINREFDMIFENSNF